MNAEQVVAVLSALAHETRLVAFRLLVQRGVDGMAAGAISDQLGISASSLSFHLQQLLQAGLVTQKRLGRQHIYAVDFATMNNLLAYLGENRSGDASYAPVCKPAE